MDWSGRSPQGKLTTLVERWWYGETGKRPDVGPLEQQLLDSGAKLTDELIAAARARDQGVQDRPKGIVELWPGQDVPVKIFFAMSTQWTRNQMTGTLQGLYYPSLQPVADALQVSLDTQAFHDLRTMERHVLKLQRKKRK